jgi:Chaperone of endosialidase
MTQKELRNLALGLAIGFSSLSALATVTLPFSFKSGDPIRSGEVNANFSSLKAFADGLESTVAGKQARVGAKCDDGSSIREIKEEGTVVCELDDVGSGGSSYTAGTGLKLTNTAFSVDTVAIQSRVTATCAAGSSIREVKPDGSVTCEADDAGSSYAAGTGLSLIGAQFSLADGGVSTAKIADGAVTGAKLTLPLSVTGPDLGSGTFAVNATGGPSIVAIVGNANDGVGVLGTNAGVGGAGIIGRNTASSGIGVSGEASVGVNSKGVSGYSEVGRGVYGSSVTGRGVYGQSTSGISGYFLGGAGGNGVCSFNGGAGWNCTSDRNAKENFRAVNTELILESLVRMSVTTWNMRGDRARTPHIGPVAQDFRAAFGMGEDSTTINTADAQGVAFAAIKGLNAKLEAENAHLRDELGDIQARLARLEILLKGRR